MHGLFSFSIEKLNGSNFENNCWRRLKKLKIEQHVKQELLLKNKKKKSQKITFATLNTNQRGKKSLFLLIYVIVILHKLFTVDFID